MRDVRLRLCPFAWACVALFLSFAFYFSFYFTFSFLYSLFSVLRRQLNRSVVLVFLFLVVADGRVRFSVFREEGVGLRREN